MALIDNLISYYKLDETSGTTGEDSTGTNDLTATNERIFTVNTESSGIINTGANFRSGEDQLQDTTFAGLTSLTTSFSLNIWAYFTASAKHTVLIELGDASHYFQLWRDKTTGVIAIRPVSFFDNDVYTTTSFTAVYNEWHMYTVTYNHSTNELKVFVDTNNVLDVTRTRDENIDDTLTVGGSVPGDYWVDGYEDEVGIWDKVLDSDEIEALYNDGSGFSYPFAAEVQRLFKGTIDEVRIYNRALSADEILALYNYENI